MTPWLILCSTLYGLWAAGPSWTVSGQLASVQKRRKKNCEEEVIPSLIWVTPLKAVSLGDGSMADIPHPFPQKFGYHRAQKGTLFSSWKWVLTFEKEDWKKDTEWFENYSLTPVSPTKTYLPGISVLTLKTKIKTKILEFLELIIILISEILESPTIREAMTFLWSMFQSLISTSHIIKYSF